MDSQIDEYSSIGARVTRKKRRAKLKANNKLEEEAASQHPGSPNSKKIKIEIDSDGEGGGEADDDDGGGDGGKKGDCGGEEEEEEIDETANERAVNGLSNGEDMIDIDESAFLNLKREFITDDVLEPQVNIKVEQPSDEENGVDDGANNYDGSVDLEEPNRVFVTVKQELDLINEENHAFADEGAMYGEEGEGEDSSSCSGGGGGGSRSDDISLVHAVRQFRELYDCWHLYYANSWRRNDCWGLVAKQLNRTAEDCRRRWNQIRDNYRKSLRRLDKTAGGATTLHGSEHLSFLEEFCRPRRLYSDNVVDDKQQKQQQIVFHTENGDIVVDDQQPVLHSDENSGDPTIPDGNDDVGEKRAMKRRRVPSSRRPMDSGETEVFLELYSQEQLLYDTGHTQYRIQEARNSAAKRICERMNVADFGPKDVSKRFKNLRDAYCTELKKKLEWERTKPPDDPYVPKLFYFEQINAFLRPFVQKRCPSGGAAPLNAKSKPKSTPTTTENSDPASTNNNNITIIVDQMHHMLEPNMLYQQSTPTSFTPFANVSNSIPLSSIPPPPPIVNLFSNVTPPNSKPPPPYLNSISNSTPLSEATNTASLPNSAPLNSVPPPLINLSAVLSAAPLSRPPPLIDLSAVLSAIPANSRPNTSSNITPIISRPNNLTTSSNTSTSIVLSISANTTPSNTRPILPNVSTTSSNTTPSISRPIPPIISTTSSNTIPSNSRPVLPIISTTFSNTIPSNSRPVLPIISTTFSNTIPSNSRPVIPIISTTFSNTIPSNSRPVLPIISTTFSNTIPSNSRPVLPNISTTSSETTPLSSSVTTCSNTISSILVAPRPPPPPYHDSLMLKLNAPLVAAAKATDQLFSNSMAETMIVEALPEEVTVDVDMDAYASSQSCDASLSDADYAEMAASADPLALDLEQNSDCGSSSYVAPPRRRHGCRFSKQKIDGTNFTEEELVDMPTRELNRRVRGLPPQLVRRLKMKRRTLKNRSYANNSRTKRSNRSHELEMQNKELLERLLRLESQLGQARSERDFYRKQCMKLCGAITPERLAAIDRDLPPQSLTQLMMQRPQSPPPLRPLSSKIAGDKSELVRDVSAAEVASDKSAAEIASDETAINIASGNSMSKVARDESKSKVDSDISKSKVDSDISKSKVDSDISKSKVDNDISKSKVDSDISKSKVDSDISMWKVSSNKPSAEWMHFLESTKSLLARKQLAETAPKEQSRLPVMSQLLGQQPSLPENNRLLLLVMGTSQATEGGPQLTLIPQETYKLEQLPGKSPLSGESRIVEELSSESKLEKLLGKLLKPSAGTEKSELKEDNHGQSRLSPSVEPLSPSQTQERFKTIESVPVERLPESEKSPERLSSRLPGKLKVKTPEQLSERTPDQLTVKPSVSEITLKQLLARSPIHIEVSQTQSPEQLSVTSPEQLESSHSSTSMEEDSILPEVILPESQKQLQLSQSQSPEQLSVKSPEQLSVESPEQLSVKSSEQLSLKSPVQLSVKSPEQLSVKSPEQLSVKSPEQLSVKSPEQLSVKSPKNLESSHSQSPKHSPMEEDSLLHEEQSPTESQEQLKSPEQLP